MAFLQMYYQELPKFEQYIFADYSNFISVENVYEDIIQQILEKDVSMGKLQTVPLFNIRLFKSEL